MQRELTKTQKGLAYMDITYSVIVPIYNTEKYLQSCLTSLSRQTFPNYEVILIDDGSTDSSGLIADTFALENRIFHVIHQKNAGLSEARKSGIREAVGTYIVFLDSDDIADTRLLESIDTYIDDSVDLLTYKSKIFIDKVSQYEHLDYNKIDTNILNREMFLTKVVRNTIINGSEAVVVWNKVYKREKILQTVADYGKSPLEDYVFNIQYYTIVSKCVQLSVVLHYYRFLNYSLSRSFNPSIFSVLLSAQQIKDKFMLNEGFNDDASKISSDRWFCNYVRNIIFQLYAYENNLNSTQKNVYLAEILRNPEVRSRFNRLQQIKDFKSRYAYLICRKMRWHIIAIAKLEGRLYMLKKWLRKILK